MYQLIYTSTPTVELTPDLRREIAAQARDANKASGLTGVLLLSDTVCLQILEGEERAVRAVYQRIMADSRHEDCDVLLDRHCQDRSFPQWSMTYCEADSEYEIKLAIVALKSRRRMRERTGETRTNRATTP